MSFKIILQTNAGDKKEFNEKGAWLFIHTNSVNELQCVSQIDRKKERERVSETCYHFIRR